MIDVKIIKDSLNVGTGDRLTTFILTYPRFIHAEVMTHRVFSRNAASSRAIPISKFRDDVASNPAMPVFWGKNTAQMQAAEELSEELDPQLPLFPDEYSLMPPRVRAEHWWRKGLNYALTVHSELQATGLHKQIVNRVLEPWFHMSLLVSATTFTNFFLQRCNSAAQPEIQVLADKMLFEYMTNAPKVMELGTWHLPFVTVPEDDLDNGSVMDDWCLISAGRAARLSYKQFDGTTDLDADLELAKRLLKNRHLSPFEHVARATDGSENDASGNFSGWVQYRKSIEHEAGQQVNLLKLFNERKALYAEIA